MNIVATYAELGRGSIITYSGQEIVSIVRPSTFCLETRTFYIWTGSEWVGIPDLTVAQAAASAAATAAVQAMPAPTVGSISGLQAALDSKAANSHNHDTVYAPKPMYSRVTGSNVTRTAQTLADITGLSVPLLANSVYEFEAVLSVASSSTAGNGYGVNFSAAGATIEAQISGTLAAATQKTLRFNAFNVAQSPFVTVAANGGILIKGIITTGANAGNLTISHLKVTSGTSTVYINSFLKAIKI